MALRDRPLVAKVKREEYQAIHRRCAERDVENTRDPGCIYDAPAGGAINVWTGPWGYSDSRATPEDWRRREASHLRGTYYHAREDYRHPGDVIESQMLALAAGRFARGLGDMTGLSGGEEIPPSRIVNVHWSPGDGDGHWPGEDQEARRAASWGPREARMHFEEIYREIFGRPLADGLDSPP